MYVKTALEWRTGSLSNRFQFLIKYIEQIPQLSVEFTQLKFDRKQKPALSTKLHDNWYNNAPR